METQVEAPASTSAPGLDKKKKVVKNFDTVTIANVHSILNKNFPHKGKVVQYRINDETSEYVSGLGVSAIHMLGSQANQLRETDKNKTILLTHIKRAVVANLPRCDGQLIYSTTINGQAKALLEQIEKDIKERKKKENEENKKKEEKKKAEKGKKTDEEEKDD